MKTAAAYVLYVTSILTTTFVTVDQNGLYFENKSGFKGGVNVKEKAAAISVCQNQVEILPSIAITNPTGKMW